MKRYKRNINIETVNIGEELGMLDVESGKYYVLDPISSKIWGMLENEIDIDGLVNLLILDFEVEKSVCYDDVSDLLNKLVENNLLEKV